MKPMLALTLSVLLLGAAPVGSAREVAGVMLDESVELGTPPATLVLNGAGVRSKFFFKIYVGALYLPERVTDPNRVLEMEGPKRVSMHFLYKEVDRDTLVETWEEGFANNTSEQERARLRERLNAFDDLFVTVRRGDVIRLDYLPGAGTQVWMNQNLRGIIAGEDFHRALLKLWLGERPGDARLKRAMLGQEQQQW